MTEPNAELSQRFARDEARRRLERRHKAEQRFRWYGLIGIATALTALAFLLASILVRGASAFVQTEIRLAIDFDPAILWPEGQLAGRPGPDDLERADFDALLRQALTQRFPDVRDRRERRDLRLMFSAGAAQDLREKVLADPGLIGSRAEVWILASADVDMLNKGRVSPLAAAHERRLNDNQLAWFETLRAEGRIARHFSRRFFASGDSREPERAGILSAALGSALALAVTIVLALPLGVAAAIYLEEFAPKNRWTDLIEVNVNNLAAVPSIVFGLLGLTVVLGTLGVARSAALAGGMVLALMTLPYIVIAARAAIRAVPPSIRDGALAVGASKHQTVWHHILPVAIPGIMTGTIIGMARALGETAPLLIIGMVAFVVDPPAALTDPATALPVQIFMWADSPERAFAERSAAAILVLLIVLALFNALAVFLRRKYERKW
jgi:phosphate transport system permease protein